MTFRSPFVLRYGDTARPRGDDVSARAQSEPIVHAKGSMQRPLSRIELQDKFIDCLGDDLAKAKTDMFEKLMNLESLNGAADLFSLQQDRGIPSTCWAR
jgi:hypothetical protein